LRAIFILLEKHGLDYPNYYKKLYQMIKPKIVNLKNAKTGEITVEIQSIFNMPEKSRFLRLLDLSLRSPVLPTQLIASFLKRLWRTVSSWGACFTNQDIMFVIAFTQNILMRHPKCLRLVHRRSSLVKDLS
jgi:U3 small nucleolar RNA-associated protein 19